ncbi:MAG: helix-turn-helix domain-containing protein [Thermoanaerobaculia bacterium]
MAIRDWRIGVVTAEVSLFRRALDYIADCAAAQTSPRVHEFALLLGWTAQKLRREWRARYGCAVKTDLDRLQVQFSMRLLAESSLNTAAIAYRSGFGNRRSLFRSFRRVTGISPGSWRKCAPLRSC